MAKYKYGDRVRNVRNHDPFIEYGEIGTVVENNSSVPYVLWDYGKKFSQLEDFLELVREVDSVILFETSSFASWDDSVEFTPTELPKIDRFTFGYEDEYGMEIAHAYNGKEFEYGLVDIIANFTLFLKGVGYTDDEISEFINEGRM